MASGTCALTLKQGAFIESHLIPQGLTKPTVRGASFMQVGVDTKPQKMWSSWYDNKLVTADGEKILSDLDDWAIKFLRRNKMVWSGWGPAQALDDKIIAGDWGVKTVDVDDPSRLHLFFVSILWRAAATRRPEFKEIVLPAKDLETMRLALINQTPPPIEFYPASLSELRTLGVAHNQSPTLATKIIPDLGQKGDKHATIFRFYFDGLITHFHAKSWDNDARELGPLIVGNENKLTISTVSYESSLQRENLISFVASTGI